MADILYLNYPNFAHSSSMQIRAAKLNTKSIVINEHLMKERCEKIDSCYYMESVEEITDESLSRIIEVKVRKSPFLDLFTFRKFKESLSIICE